MKYRLTKRAGRNVAVSYFEDGKWSPWKTTGCSSLLEAEEKIKEENILTFRDYAEGFYNRDDQKSWSRRRRIRNKSVTEGTRWQKQEILDKYLIPVFGDLRLVDIKATMIEEWFTTLRGVKSGKELSPIRCNAILTTHREVLKFAVADGHVPCNEAYKIDGMAQRTKEKAPISHEEILKLFPDDDDKLIEMWGKDYALYFLIFIDTGFRPCEILALRYEDIRKDAVYTERIYDPYTEQIQHRIKTSKKGKKYKIGTLSERTLALLGKGTGQIFDTSVMSTRKAWRLFKDKAMMLLGRDDVTQYQLRHCFMTDLMPVYPKELIMELMGHTRWHKCYDDRTPEKIIENLRMALSRYQAQC